jgi:hypothetical protein
MRTPTRRFTFPSTLAALGLLGCMAFAQARADDGDPPDRAARVSDLEGAVSLQPAGFSDWIAASLNRPLTTGDRVWTDQDARAELDIGDAVIRLGSGTGFAFLNLDDSLAQMQLTGGTLIVRVRDVQADQVYEVDTPNVAVSLEEPGEYRVEVNERGDTTVVKVGDGAAQAAGAGATIAIGAQQQVIFTGTTKLAYDTQALAPPDAFDSWSAGREQQVDDSASAGYVAPAVPGAQDLDNSGRWQDTPDYGYVWTPTAVAVGWVPYRFGHWAWITPWGWTWVDDAAWGYAPFHYGRWVQWNNVWAWVPGPRGLRPAYAPALVAWVGAPSAGAPAVFGSNVGWFPLGPHEVYLPAYRVSVNYVRNVNLTNTTGINNTAIASIYQNNMPPAHYANNRPAAVTAVAQNIFVAAQRVGANALRLPPAVLAGALVTGSAPAIAPTRQSALGPPPPRGVARPPAALTRRSVVAHAIPPRAPVPFEEQLAAMQGSGGRPLGRAQLARLQPDGPPAGVRVLAATGAVIAASGLPHHAVSSHAAEPMRPAAASAPASFAERQRILAQPNRLIEPVNAMSAPPTTRPNAFVPPTFAPPSYYAPAWRSDRPPVAAAATAPLTPPAADSVPARAPHVDTAAPLPVYHMPGEVPAEPAAQRSSRQDRPPAARAPASAPAPPSKPAHDAPAHADRDSRERLVR